MAGSSRIAEVRPGLNNIVDIPIELWYMTWSNAKIVVPSWGNAEGRMQNEAAVTPKATNVRSCMVLIASRHLLSVEHCDSHGLINRKN
jgi:hypothetical protein